MTADRLSVKKDVFRSLTVAVGSDGLLTACEFHDNGNERERLCQLRDAFRSGRRSRYPVELTWPKARTDQTSELLRAQDAEIDP
jgi:hypothetical protein